MTTENKTAKPALEIIEVHCFPDTARFSHHEVACRDNSYHSGLTNKNHSFTLTVKYDRVLKTLEIDPDEIDLDERVLEGFSIIKDALTSEIQEYQNEAQLFVIIDGFVGEYWDEDVFTENGIENFFTYLGVPKAEVKRWIKEGVPYVAHELAEEYVRNTKKEIEAEDD